MNILIDFEPWDEGDTTYWVNPKHVSIVQAWNTGTSLTIFGVERLLRDKPDVVLARLRGQALPDERQRVAGVHAVDLPPPPGVKPMEPGPTLITGLPVCEGCYASTDTTLADLTTPPLPTCQRCGERTADRLVQETTRCNFRRTNSKDLEQCEREAGHAGSCQAGNASWFR